jgi:hypothetical protein
MAADPRSTRPQAKWSCLSAFSVLEICNVPSVHKWSHTQKHTHTLCEQLPSFNYKSIPCTEISLAKEWQNGITSHSWLQMIVFSTVRSIISSYSVLLSFSVPSQVASMHQDTYVSTHKATHDACLQHLQTWRRPTATPASRACPRKSALHTKVLPAAAAEPLLPR